MSENRSRLRKISREQLFKNSINTRPNPVHSYTGKENIGNIEKNEIITSVIEDNENKIVSVDSLGNNGRLGNQLFQIASAIGIASKNNTEFCLDNWFCQYTQKDMSKFFKNSLPYNSDIKFNNRIIERYFQYDPDIKISGNTILKGYYQSEKYFIDIQDKIRYYFEPSIELQKKIEKIYLSINPKKLETCSLHVRRGDYVNHSLHEVCNIEYYKNAISNIKNRKNIGLFLIFSDDIHWCKENFKDEIFVFSEELMDIEDLFLMSLCDNHIISNSSFSWWGSWLCKNMDKIIITPNKWFSDSRSLIDRDIFCQNHIKI
jgi:hypothetical protein